MFYKLPTIRLGQMSNNITIAGAKTANKVIFSHV